MCRQRCMRKWMSGGFAADVPIVHTPKVGMLRRAAGGQVLINRGQKTPTSSCCRSRYTHEVLGNVGCEEAIRICGWWLDPRLHATDARAGQDWGSTSISWGIPQVRPMPMLMTIGLGTSSNVCWGSSRSGLERLGFCICFPYLSYQVFSCVFISLSLSLPYYIYIYIRI